MAARPPALSPESTINHEGPFCASLVSRRSFGLATASYWGTGERTMWLRRLAAPRPVGPMPMTRTSTLLQLCCQNEALYGWSRPGRRLVEGSGRKTYVSAIVKAG